MRVLVLGAGAKDHAIAWWFSRSTLISALYMAPGNPCTSDIAINLEDVDPADKEAVYAAVKEHRIDYVFTGTEAPLFSGVIEYLQRRGIATFGVPERSLRLESDRTFARAFTSRHNIKTPRNSVFAEIESLERYLEKHNGERFMIKSNAMTPSRIMMESSEAAPLIEYAKTLFRLGPVMLEEYIEGVSATCTLLMDKNGYILLPVASEYTSTKAYQGIATGGMGAVCPLPIIEDVRQAIEDEIIKPLLYGMKVEQLSYRGVLTLSIKITPDLTPYLIDFHVRFNDPATQAMIPTIRTDIVTILRAMAQNKLNTIELETSEGYTVAVVLAADGYPDSPLLGKEIDGVSYVFRTGCSGRPDVFGGAMRIEHGRMVVAGGRCLTVVGHGMSVEEANQSAYHLIKTKRFDNLWYRDDIGLEYFRSGQLS